jgi:hypothetical protein
MLTFLLAVFFSFCATFLIFRKSINQERKN